MSEKFKNWVKFGISAIALGAFLRFYWVLLTGEWSQGNQPTSNFLEATSGLTGMVSGVVAVMLGIAVRDPGNGSLGKMGKIVSPSDKEKAKQLIAVLYCLGYFGMAAWAFLVWLGPPDAYRPQIIDGLAAVGFGVVLSVVPSYFAKDK